jgi:hypothetical protein
VSVPASTARACSRIASVAAPVTFAACTCAPFTEAITSRCWPSRASVSRIWALAFETSPAIVPWIWE